MRAALETFLAPVDDLDGWRDAVCERVRALAGADIAFFRLSDRGPSRIAPAGPLAARDAYRREFRELDPWPRVSVRPGQSRIETQEGVIGEERLRRDPYYNEFIRPYGLRDYVGLQVGTSPGAHAHIGVFNSGRSGGGARQAFIIRGLRLVLPAFETGLRTWLATQHACLGIGPMLDAIAEPLALCGSGGRALHANAALARLLARDPDEVVLAGAIADSARAMAAARAGQAGELAAAAAPRRVTTPVGTYIIRCVSLDPSLAPGAAALLLVEPPRRRAPSDAALRDRYGLTARETETARILAEGADNAALADALGVGAVTARNHTARVLRKLGLRSRAQVHSILHP